MNRPPVVMKIEDVENGVSFVNVRPNVDDHDYCFFFAHVSHLQAKHGQQGREQGGQHNRQPHKSKAPADQPKAAGGPFEALAGLGAAKAGE